MVKFSGKKGNPARKTLFIAPRHKERSKQPIAIYRPGICQQSKPFDFDPFRHDWL